MALLHVCHVVAVWLTAVVNWHTQGVAESPVLVLMHVFSHKLCYLLHSVGLERRGTRD